MKIAYQGVPGSYSETTLQHYVAQHGLPLAEAIGYQSFTEVLDALVSGVVDLVVLPVENSTTGLITRTMDLLRGVPCHVVDEWYLPIQHTLWGVPGSSMETVQAVYSHPEALSQCQHFFTTHPEMTPVSYEDTAKAAAYIAEQGDVRFAALSSERAGALFNLVPLQRQLQNESHNTTRFFILKAGVAPEVSLQQRAYFYLETTHTPGALLKILNIFDMFQCNLEGLNARPIAQTRFKYGFYIEVDFSTMTMPFGVLRQVLEQHCEMLQYFGSFSRFVARENEEE